jgi:hypothetical protein
LRFEIAFADKIAVFVECRLSGDKDDSAAGDFDDVGGGASSSGLESRIAGSDAFRAMVYLRPRLGSAFVAKVARPRLILPRASARSRLLAWLTSPIGAGDIR